MWASNVACEDQSRAAPGHTIRSRMDPSASSKLFTPRLRDIRSMSRGVKGEFGRRLLNHGMLRSRGTLLSPAPGLTQPAMDRSRDAASRTMNRRQLDQGKSGPASDIEDVDRISKLEMIEEKSSEAGRPQGEFIVVRDEGRIFKVVATVEVIRHGSLILHSKLCIFHFEFNWVAGARPVK